jgi:23S rRNA pseudouridine2605 synthase
MERLHKVLASAGVASRRQCERIIADGRVTVNGDTVTEMGTQVDPDKDDIRCDGARIRTEHKVYYLLNKPRGCLCTQKDEYGRKRAVDLLVGVTERVFPVGRLDRESQGLLLLTNDGELANRLTHPRYGVPKTYLALVRGEVKAADLDTLKKGLHLAEGAVKAEDAAIQFSDGHETVLRIVLREGRNREVRRMMARLGYRVKRLRRVSIGSLTDEGLEVGRFRPLTREEVAGLWRGDESGPGEESRRDSPRKQDRRRRKGGRRRWGVKSKK